MPKLERQVAVVTGGGTGMGRAICLQLALEGAAVVVNYSRSQTEAEALAAEITGAGGRALAIKADVSQDAEVMAMIDRAAGEFGRLDILVNNAGYTSRVAHQNLAGLTEDLLDRVLAVNVKGPLYCCRAAIPHMQKNGGGAIVNITSVAGLRGAGSSMIYGASKAALSNLTKSLARAFAPTIQVNAVAPGYVHTGFGAWPPETAAEATKNSQIGRIVTVEDVAAAVLFFVTEGRMLTGQEMVLDGGVFALGARTT